jgi:hypothetical protein
MDRAVSPSDGNSLTQGPQASPPIDILLQKPNRWSETHLQVARVKVTENVSIEELLGSEYVPIGGDQGNKYLVILDHFIFPYRA